MREPLRTRRGGHGRAQATTTVELLCMAVLAFRLALMYRFLVPSRFWFDPKVSGLLAIIIVRQRARRRRAGLRRC